MNPTDSPLRFCLLAIVATITSGLVAIFYPYGTSLVDATHRSILFSVAWVFTQAFWLVSPGLFLGLIRFSKRGIRIIAHGWILAVPLVILFDNVAFSWIAERFLSMAVWRVFTQFPRLVGHIAISTWMLLGGMIVAYVVFVFVANWTSKNLAQCIQSRLKSKSVAPVMLVSTALVVSLLITGVAIFHARTTFAEMYAGSARHPFCSFRFVDSASVGSYAEVVAPNLESRQPRISGMEQTLRRCDVRQKSISVSTTPQSLPDVVVVIIESLRHELIDPEVMPTLSELASKGVHCSNHFSGGNATSHGMFSLINGLDATWYPRAVRNDPILNRLFHEAGYQIGFFAGHDDWPKFQMDGFINSKHFDQFRTDRPNWLETDRRATQRAAAFLDEDPSLRPPRLAVLYLYSTHADYRSYANDQVFQPTADERFVIPYGKADVPRVWNRYKNAARSVDRFLKVMLRDDRACVVTGDHGEAFLEDGVCGHGARISKYQNMTPAVVFCPNRPPMSIPAPTSHCDLLPTLLAATKIQVSDVDVFDGVNLYEVSESDLKQRVVLTRNYLNDDCGLVRWQNTETDVFAYRAAISLLEWNAVSLNAINEKGNEMASDSAVGQALLRQWIIDRFGKESVASNADSSIGR